ncbi:hypothetical protein LTR78_004870 [Recurvomyces mirabilis]|uniref:Uncharacterized protein n=1 Tax=Recurvomyces mirabilis TaxID=574656 RepID=A0AAE0WP13_9PEZI|nr:hypothetical protein LTR78_004870 [Recurvomyces mirabilis]KAK4552191.1 hypothetical protein LTR86_010545 [Recurvomyces mirabilis]
MPNSSETDRIMIAIGYQAPWYPNHKQRLYLPLEHVDFFMRHGGQPVEVRAEFLGPNEMEGLYKNYDFSFEPHHVSQQRRPAKL